MPEEYGTVRYIIHGNLAACHFNNGMSGHDERDTSGRGGAERTHARHRRHWLKFWLYTMYLTPKVMLDCHSESKFRCAGYVIKTPRIASNAGNSNPRRYRKSQQNGLKMDIHSCILFTKFKTMQPDNPKSNVSSIKCIGYVPRALLDVGASKPQFQYTFNVFCFVRYGYFTVGTSDRRRGTGPQPGASACWFVRPN